MGHWKTKKPVWVISLDDRGTLISTPGGALGVATYATRAIARPILAQARKKYGAARLARVEVKFEEIA